MSTALPDYKQPPVVEVLIAVFFARLESFTVIDYGMFLEKIRDRYPKIEERTPLLTGSASELLTLPPYPRLIFKDESESFLMQLQPDVFISNWRKQKSIDQYPHFGEAQGRFWTGWKLLQEMAEERSLGKIQPSRFEVTYLNQLVPDQGVSAIRAMSELVPLVDLSFLNAGKILPAPKTANLVLQFPMDAKDATLTATLQQGNRTEDNREVLQLELTARMFASGSEGELENFLDEAHRWIVQGFTDLTSATAHKKWERFV